MEEYSDDENEFNLQQCFDYYTHKHLKAVYPYGREKELEVVNMVSLIMSNTNQKLQELEEDDDMIAQKDFFFSLKMDEIALHTPKQILRLPKKSKKMQPLLLQVGPIQKLHLKDMFCSAWTLKKGQSSGLNNPQ